MTEAVFKSFGPLNRFMGDELMGSFGALRGGESQEEHAVRAALEMRTALNDLQARWVKSENEARDAMTSLRINTGRAIVGKIGSKERMELISIGQSINLASRHHGATRDRADILVSGYSDVAACSRFPFEPIGQISIEGKADSARTHMIKTVS